MMQALPVRYVVYDVMQYRKEENGSGALHNRSKPGKHSDKNMTG